MKQNYMLGSLCIIMILLFAVPKANAQIGNQCDTALITNVSCFGLCDGAIDYTWLCGAPVTYLWSNGATTEDLTGLCAGTYTVIVSNSVGQTASHTFVISQPPQLVVTLTTTKDLCQGGCLRPIVSGGTSPYFYSWNVNPGLSALLLCPQQPATILPPGTYIVTVTDSNGCTATAVYTVGPCCHLICPKDTSICFNLPDSLVVLSRPTVSDSTCNADSAKYIVVGGQFGMGQTTVKWYLPGSTDTCIQIVTRNPPINVNLIWTSVPPAIGGVINICLGACVTFNDLSTGTSNIRDWDFGDGYHSGAKNPTHCYNIQGTWNGRLTVFDDCGNKYDSAFTVIVDPTPGPDIKCPSVVCAGDTGHYSTSAAGCIYTWTVIPPSSGTIIGPANQQNVNVAWGPGPQGILSLTVTGCGGFCSQPSMVVIHIVPATMPIAGSTVVCQGAVSDYQVECLQGNSHTWSVAPSNAGTITGQGTCHITIAWDPNFTGSATVCCNYHNILTGAGCSLPGACVDSGCGGNTCITVLVKPVFKINGPTKVCANTLSAPFNANSGSATWKVIPASLAPPFINFASTALLNAYLWNNGTGFYKVIAYAPAGQFCNDSAMMIVEVISVLKPVLSGPLIVCPGPKTYTYTVTPNVNNATYTYTVVGGAPASTVTSSTSITVTWGATGGTISVSQQTGGTPNCASDTASLAVTTFGNIALPVVSGTNPACNKTDGFYNYAGLPIPGATYVWSVVPATAGNITSPNGLNNVTVHWVSAGPAIVKLKISLCNDDSVMYPVTVNPLPPTPVITPPSPLCAGVPGTFTGPAGMWDYGDPAGTYVAQGINPTHTYLYSGNYTVSVYVTLNGCADTGKAIVKVDSVPPLPTINVGPSTACASGTFTYSFPSSQVFSGATYTWSITPPTLGNIISSTSNTATIQWDAVNAITPGNIVLTISSTCPIGPVSYPVTITPVPSPSFSPLQACQGTPTLFTGSAIGTWFFEGVNAGTGLTMSNTFATPGTKTVELDVTDINGCVGKVSKLVNVKPAPVASISTAGPTSYCIGVPFSITLSALNAAGYTFSWNGPGGTNGILPNLPVTDVLWGAGTYNVTVTNSLTGCSATSNNISISVNTCGGGGNDTVCVPDDPTSFVSFTKSLTGCSTVNFVGSGSVNVTNYSYTFGDGFGAIGINASHTYTSPGIFTATIYGQVPGHTVPGNLPCTAIISSSQTVVIPLLANFNWEYNCPSGTILTNLKDLSLAAVGNTITSWLWTGGSTLQNPTGQLIANNTPITLTITSNTGAVCSVTKNVTVPTPVVPSFTPSTPLCLGTPVTFTNTSTPIGDVITNFWNFGVAPPATSNATNPQYTYPTSGVKTITLTVVDLYGCTNSVPMNVTINAPVTGTIIGALSGCGSVTLTAPCNPNYLWSNNATTSSITVTNSGSYSVQALSCNGNLCPFTSVPVNVTINPNPPALISGKKGYCPGDSIDLKTIAGAGFSYLWKKIPPNITVGTNSPNYNTDTVPGPGLHTYEVLVTDLNGCTSTASVTIEVDTLPGPLIITPGDVTICQSDTPYVIQAPTGPGTFYTYLWSKTPPPNVTGTALSFNVLTTGDYSVTITTKNKCVVNIGPRKVLVNPLPPAVIIGKLVYCEHDTLILTTPPGYTYQWKFNFINISGATNNVYSIPNVNPTHSGNYSVVVTDPNTGCSFADTVAVIVNPVPATPIIAANMPTPLCVGQLFMFNVTNPTGPPITYLWNTGQTGILIPAAIAGGYYVHAINSITGCKAKSNILTINPTPDLSCVPTGCYDLCTECVLADTIVIPGPDGFASYNWQIKNGIVWQNYGPANSKDLFLTDTLCHDFRLIAFNAAGCTDTSGILNICFNRCCTPPPPPDTCTYVTNIFFNDIPSNLHGFGPWAPEPNVNVSISNVGSKQGQFDKYVRVVDLPGASKLSTGSQFFGKWCCSLFCWDEKIFTDSLPGVLNVNPQFIIKRGTKGFIFTSIKVINENSPWTVIHAPGCPDSMPNNPTLGTWAPLTGTLVTDWGYVAANVTDVVFVTDYAGGVGEITGIDNVRLIPKPLQLNCFGVPPCTATDSDGAAFVFVTDTGGCNTFHYLWSNGATTPSITGIPVGTYCVTVTNCCGCIDSCCVTILPGDSIVIGDTITHVHCPDTANGGIDIFVSGGTPPYTYEWSNGAITQDITGLTTGTYTVTVGCASGCVKTASYVVSVTPQCVCNPPPPLPTISVNSSTPANCNATGCIHVSVTGCCPFQYYYIYTSPCNPAITYAVQSTSDSSVFCNLPSGNYTLYVIDGCGRTASATAVVGSTVAPLSAFVQFGNCNGPMCVQPGGGCPPYSYLWSNGQTTACATIDPCHPYIVTVTDSKGCTVSQSGTMPFVGFNNIIEPNCCFSNGRICAVATCFDPATYTYLWSNGQTTQCANGLAAGTYCVTITNSIGQHMTCCYTLVCVPINVIAVVTPVACKGSSTGAISVTVNGGNPPYTYLWSTTPPKTTATALGLKAGTYTVTITDANGCSTTASYTLVQSAASLVVNMSKTNIRCGGKCTGSASAIPTGGISPYSYMWSNSANTAAISNLCPGVYTCVVTDAVGCTKTATVNITQNPALIVVVTALPATASATASASGGVGPYTYLWNTVPGQTTATAGGLLPGHTYKVKVTDSKGCTKLASVTMPAPRFGNGDAPVINARVYPNPTDGKLNLQFDDDGDFAYTVCLYNSIGQEAFCQAGYKNEGAANSMYDLSTLPKGLYMLVLTTEKGNMVVKVVLE